METMSDEFQCGECHEKVTNITQFLLHKIQHVEMGKPGACPLCGMAFSRQVSLREHLHRKHNIPQIKSHANTGKREKPRKVGAVIVTESSSEAVPETESKTMVTKRESESTATVIESKVITTHMEEETSAVSTEKEIMTITSSEPTEPNNDSVPQTMHVVIDKIREGDLGAADLCESVLQGNCPVVFPSTNTVMVETSDIKELGHLIEHVNVVSQPQTFQTTPHNAQNQSHSVPSQTSIFQNHTCSLQNHTHTFQGKCHTECGDSSPPLQDTHVPVQNNSHALHNQQNMLENQPGTVQRLNCEEDLNTSSSSNLAHTVIVDSKYSHSPNTQQAKSSKEAASEEDPDFDFLFVLLTNHVKRKSFNYSKQVFKCFHCQYKTSWRRALVKHMRDNHADNLAIHQCITVNKSEKLQDQQVMKMSEYTMVLARQRRQVNNHRIRGVERQDLPGYHPCNKCDKVFGRLRYLRKHQVIHKAEKKFLCDDCGKAFKTKAYLAAHRQTHQVKVYKCSQCDFTSSFNTLIHTHRQLHNDNSVVCEICGSAYNDRTTLKKHKLVHDKTRPYPCAFPGCTWRFKSEVMCRAHFRGHTTSGRFVCHLCSYVFRHKHHLQRHLGKVHGMDEASVYRTTSSNKSQAHAKTIALEACEDRELVQVVQEENQPLADTVNLIVNSGLSSEQLQSVLESGQFVIATDENDSSVNYEVANISMNVSYDSLAESAGGVMEGQAILLPNDAECSQIIFQQETVSETVPASIET